MESCRPQFRVVGSEVGSCTDLVGFCFRSLRRRERLALLSFYLPHWSVVGWRAGPPFQVEMVGRQEPLAVQASSAALLLFRVGLLTSATCSPE